MADRAEEARRRITSLLAALDAEDGLSSEDRAVVSLDQQSVGRLSRMDAMQRQAMAAATARRRATERRRLTAALDRIDEEEYGYCLDCGDEISPARLDLDPAATRCISCAKG